MLVLAFAPCAGGSFLPSTVCKYFTCTRGDQHLLQLVLVVFFFHQLEQILHLHMWWSSPVATFAGGIFPPSHWRKYSSCIHATCTVWWWYIRLYTWVAICPMQLQVGCMFMHAIGCHNAQTLSEWHHCQQYIRLQYSCRCAAHECHTACMPTMCGVWGEVGLIKKMDWLMIYHHHLGDPDLKLHRPQYVTFTSTLLTPSSTHTTSTTCTVSYIPHPTETVCQINTVSCL